MSLYIELFIHTYIYIYIYIYILCICGLTIFSDLRLTFYSFTPSENRFDVTPAKYITAIITEKGVIHPNANGDFDIAAFVAQHHMGSD